MNKEVLYPPEFKEFDAPIALEPKLAPAGDQHTRFLGSNLNKALALTATVLTLSGINIAREAIFMPDRAQAAPIECTTSTTTTTLPDGTTTKTETTTCSTIEDSADNGSLEPDSPSRADSQEGNKGQGAKPDQNETKRGSKKHSGPRLLEVPKKKDRRHWATKILNEVRKGKKGRISANKEVIVDLNRTRKGKCAHVEQTGDCVKVDKALLKLLYKASKIRKFFIWHLTDGPHVPTSFHFSNNACKAADLRRFNRKAPTNKSMFNVLRRVKPKNKDLELIGPGDDVHHTGPKNGHIHVAVH